MHGALRGIHAALAATLAWTAMAVAPGAPAEARRSDAGWGGVPISAECAAYIGELERAGAMPPPQARALRMYLVRAGSAYSAGNRDAALRSLRSYQSLVDRFVRARILAPSAGSELRNGVQGYVETLSYQY